MIETLLEQRELIDAQITDFKTRDIKQNITELEANSRILLTKLRDAKSRKSITDSEIAEQMKGLYLEIENLKKLSFSEIYFVSQVQAEFNENSQKIAEYKSQLRKILDDDANYN
jgi:hypothetical protein